MSISSTTQSIGSSSSYTRGRGLNAKLSELENYRGILVHQIDIMQEYFDLLASSSVDGKNGQSDGGATSDVTVSSGSSSPKLVNGPTVVEDLDTPTPTAYIDTRESPFFRTPVLSSSANKIGKYLNTL